jgi:hypothetical protein
MRTPNLSYDPKSEAEKAFSFWPVMDEFTMLPVVSGVDASALVVPRAVTTMEPINRKIRKAVKGHLRENFLHPLLEGKE